MLAQANGSITVGGRSFSDVVEEVATESGHEFVWTSATWVLFWGDNDNNSIGRSVGVGVRGFTWSLEYGSPKSMAIYGMVSFQKPVMTKS